MKKQSIPLLALTKQTLQQIHLLSPPISLSSKLNTLRIAQLNQVSEILINLGYSQEVVFLTNYFNFCSGWVMDIGPNT